MHATGSIAPMHPCTQPQACPASFPGPQPLQSPPPSKDRQVRPFAPFRATQPEAPSRHVCQGSHTGLPTSLTFLLLPRCSSAGLFSRGPTGWSSHRPEATQLCPTQVSGPQSTDIALSNGAPSAPCTEPGAKPSTSSPGTAPHLLLCRGGPLPGPSASCSLCSRAASSPAGLRWARTGSCSYSTHRLPSVSLVTGEPAGLHVGSQVTNAHQALGSSVPACHPPAGGSPPSTLWAPPGCATPVTHPCVAASDWGHARPDLWPSWWGGPGDTDTDTMPSPSPRPGAAAQGLAQASRQSQVVRGHNRPIPEVGMREHIQLVLGLTVFWATRKNWARLG